MKYIRTKDKIIDLTSKQVSSYEIIDDKTAVDEYGEDSGFIMVYYYDRDIGEHIEYDNKGGHSMNNWYLKDIVKQADTIEELCDELVLKDLDTEMCFVMSAVHIQDIRDNWENLMDNDYLKNHTIYGAIWTDKGLIYVAKWNKESDRLELL